MTEETGFWIPKQSLAEWPYVLDEIKEVDRVGVTLSYLILRVSQFAALLRVRRLSNTCFFLLSSGET